MKVLFVGGTGIISSACSRLAVERGYDLYLLCRGESPRPAPAGATLLKADINNESAVAAMLNGHHFDAVVNFIVFEPSQIERDIRLFFGRTRQYVFISSASTYKKPLNHWPITESTPLCNPYWDYSRNKIACEAVLMHAYVQRGFPATIIRPSHTYDETLLPFDPYLGGGTVLSRMREGKPVIVHGDGTSLWVLTHNTDFARGFVPLLGDQRTLGEALHITSNELLSWNEIYRLVGQAAGVKPSLVHVPSSAIARAHASWGAGLLGDKAHSVIFDNTKLRSFVPHYVPQIPFHRAVQSIVDYHQANPNFEPVNRELDELMDQLAQRWS